MQLVCLPQTWACTCHLPPDVPFVLPELRLLGH